MTSDFQDALGFLQGYLSTPVVAGVVQLFAFFAIPEHFGPLRGRKLGRLHRRVYCPHVGWVLALSESYIRCD